MPRSAVSDQSERTHDSNTLRKVEQRAENAERRVEQLEARLNQLDDSRTQQSSNLNESRTAEDPNSPRSESAQSTQDEVLAALRNEPMMDHLLNALESGKDIGHYGRLVFAMVAHHFLPEDEMLRWLTKDPGTNEEDVTVLLRQVEGRDYNPPRRDRILSWQSQQEFPILPNPDDPDCGNVYRNLKFPQSVYEHIQEYQEEKIQAHGPKRKPQIPGNLRCFLYPLITFTRLEALPNSSAAPHLAREFRVYPVTTCPRAQPRARMHRPART